MFTCCPQLLTGGVMKDGFEAPRSSSRHGMRASPLRMRTIGCRLWGTLKGTVRAYLTHSVMEKRLITQSAGGECSRGQSVQWVQRRRKCVRPSISISTRSTATARDRHDAQGILERLDKLEGLGV